MTKKSPTTLLAAALCLSSLAVPAAPSEPEEKPKDDPAAAFADPLLKAAERISERYYVEISQGRLIEWAIRGLYGRVGRDAPPEIDERLQAAGGMKPEELRNLLIDARKDIARPDGRHYVEEMSDDRFFDLALEAMCGRLDEGTRVIYGGQRLNTESMPTPVGVGLRLQTDPPTGQIEVVTPFLDGPAYKAGVRAGDLIAQITVLDDADGKPLGHPEVVSTKGLSAAAASRRLTGAYETRVRLTVRRAGEEKEYTLVRGPAAAEAVVGRRRKPDDRWDYWLDAGKKLAYIRIIRFTDRDWRPWRDPWDTPNELKKALDDLEKGGLKGLVLDLRFANEGLLTPAVDFSDLLIDDGAITTIRSRGRTKETFTGKHEGSRLGFPIVCLVNGETARAAEVVAACLQDHRRAVVMGDRTKGDGLIWNVGISGDEGRVLRIATAGLHRPDGRKLYRARPCDADDDEWGVTPDAGYVLKLPPKERDELADRLDRETFIPPQGGAVPTDKSEFKDRQLEMALEYLRLHGG